MKNAALTLGLAALGAGNPLAYHNNAKRDSPEEARLVISLGAGDSSTTLAAALDTTVVTNFFNRNSVKTAVNEQGVFCGGFQDSGATILVGEIFDSANPARYSERSDGGVGSVREDATVIGSYWCSRNKMAVEKRAKEVIIPAPQGGGTTGGERKNTDNNNGEGNQDNQNGNENNNNNNVGGGGADPGAVVDLQIEQQPDQFIGVTIPLNRLITEEDNRRLGRNIILLDIVGVEGVDANLVTCQVFFDTLGAEPLGPPATLREAALVGPRRTQSVQFGSILCSDSPQGGGNNGGNNGGGNNGGNVSGNVRLQIETESDEFRGTDVPVNQLVTVDENRQLVGRAIRIDVVGGEAGSNIVDANIKCQAWADAEGREPIGRPATVDLAAELSMDRSDPAQFKAITCNA